MAERRVILITGVSNYWGSSVAERLLARSKKSQLESIPKSSDPPVVDYQIIGVDPSPLERSIEGLDTIQTDVRNPLFVDLLKSEGVDTVCHLDFRYSYQRSEKIFDANVIGTMKLIAACVEAGVRKVVLKSSTMAYGANWENPAFLTEAHPIQGNKKFGYVRDMVEIESFCNGYCQGSPSLTISLLRFPGIIGPESNTPMNQYLRMKMVPVLLGFDPMMQIIRESDVVRALLQVIDGDYPGAFNVAAQGVLPLRGLIGRAGKLALPVFHPAAYLATDLFGLSRLPLIEITPLDWDFLRYSWVADLKRMQEVLRFSPEYTAKEALEDFNHNEKLRRFDEDAGGMMSDPQYLKGIIQRRLRYRGSDSRKGDSLDE